MACVSSVTVSSVEGDQGQTITVQPSFKNALLIRTLYGQFSMNPSVSLLMGSFGPGGLAILNLSQLKGLALRNLWSLHWLPICIRWGRGYSWESLVEVCCLVLQILTLFQTKWYHFSHRLSDLACKIHTRFQTWHLSIIMSSLLRLEQQQKKIS